MDYLLLLAGLAGLLGGGDALVRGASGLARTLGVSPIVVGLTVVAFGTSSPELVVNVLGALSGETDIAFGNVTGSNLANLGLVLGITAVIAPILVQGQIVRREIPLLMLGSAMLLVFASDDVLRGESPMIDRADGLGLLLVFCVFVYVLAGDLIRSRGADPLFSEISEVRRFQVMRPAYRDLFWLLGGLVLLYFGGRLTIDSGSAGAGLGRAVRGGGDRAHRHRHQPAGARDLGGCRLSKRARPGGGQSGGIEHLQRAVRAARERSHRGHPGTAGRRCGSHASGCCWRRC
ncbi:MAG: sodium:calcium antiporter [Pseudomonadales bacterium]